MDGAALGLHPVGLGTANNFAISGGLRGHALQRTANCSLEARGADLLIRAPPPSLEETPTMCQDILNCVCVWGGGNYPWRSRPMRFNKRPDQPTKGATSRNPPW